MGHYPAQSFEREGLLQDGINGKVIALQLAREGRNHQNWLRRRALLDTQGEFITFHLRHVKIGNHQVKLVFLKDSERFGAIGSLDHDVLIEPKQGANGLPH